MNALGAPGKVAAMWAAWLRPGGVNLFTAPATSFTDCVVHINGSLWPNWLTDDYDFAAHDQRIR
jgi:hypothetical protein